MRSVLTILLLAVQLACINANFNINITGNPIYAETYLSPLEGHIGAGLDLALVSAAPDPEYVWQPDASNRSGPAYAALSYYNIYSGYDMLVTLAVETTSNVWRVFVGGGGSLNFTFRDTDGALRPEGADANGAWKLCNTFDDEYGNFTAVNWFNGTGTPDNDECADIELIHG